ncbi:MAG: glycosyltransferase family 39 protein [Nanoarchaeota archaeon]|nr:glycosyltransferase family 39 protein [Nanoarchaeota archaeon]
MKIKIDKITAFLIIAVIASIIIRFYNLNGFGYSTDEPIIITAGIKHFLNNAYSTSLYDMATPGGQWPIGLSVTLLSDRDFSVIRDFTEMDYASIDANKNLLMGLETYARIPSAIAGLLSGVFVYLLVKEMYGRKAALISFLFFSFNPVIIDYSRIALLEIFQIFYMMAGLYFLYLSISRKDKVYRNLILSGVFFGLTGAAKLNGLMILPLALILLIIRRVSVKKKKNELSIDVLSAARDCLLLLIPSILTLGIVFGFDFSVPLKVYEYYSEAGGAGVQFVLFDLLYDALFFINPIFWIFLGVSLFLIYKERKELKTNDYFSIFLIVVLLASGFFEAHESIKRGIQYISLLFIISGRVFSNKNSKRTKSKYYYYAAIIMVLIDLALVLYYFPNTGLAKSIVCVSQECQDAHATRNINSRMVGEYLDSIPDAVVFDTIQTTGLIGFYIDSYERYMPGGIARLLLGSCPNFTQLKEGGFNKVVENDGCFSAISEELKNCPYETITFRNYEMVKIYDISGC